MKNSDFGFRRYHLLRWICSLAFYSLGAGTAAFAGLHYNDVSPGNVPWPGGVVPYVIDPALSVAQQQTYLDGLREYELAANVHFVPRTSETQYVLFKYAPGGPNSVTGSNPQLVEISQLTRGQICHEMGHSFGLQHEHIRADRNSFVNVLTANITAGNQHWFDIDPNSTAQGAYDFESVMHFGRDLFSIQPGVLDTLQPLPAYARFQTRLGGLALSKGDRAVMKYLYGAGPALSPVVTNTSESGVGSLRAAIHYASDHPGTTITFNIPTSDPNYAGGVFTIYLTGHLPPFVVDGTNIDATTQPGYAGTPLIVLDGSKILPEAGSVPGLLMYAASSTVKGLSFQRFPWVGLAMLLPDAHHNQVCACHFGVNAAGSAAPNVKQGIQISNGAYSNTIGGTTAAERNVISGNTEYGIWISGATTTGNVVPGNYIGTNASGLAAVPNGFGGVIVTDGAFLNTIGGSVAGARNLISGNANAGIWITGAGVDQNAVRGNYIGLNATGTSAVPNSFAGLYILDGAENTVVADNVMSGNGSEGMRIAGAGTSGNNVRGNRFGTSPDGSTAIGNGFAGLAIYGGASSNIIGGTTAATRNLLSGNGTVGLVFGDANTRDNYAQGNYIGTDATGTASVPNGFAGVYLVGGAEENQLGGTLPGAGNLISGNATYGIFIADAGTDANRIRGNLIGTSASGATALGNGYAGISIFGGAKSNVIGGIVGGRNVISGHDTYGIMIADPGTDSNVIRGNTIGLNATGTAPIPNVYTGIAMQNNAMLNQVGGTAPGESNLIAGNGGAGIIVFNSGTRRNTFSGNSIRDNVHAGIALYDGSNDAQPAPVLNSAVLGTSTVIAGDLTAAPTTTYRIEFFSNPGADSSGTGEGSVYLGGTTVATNGSGLASINWSTAPTVRPGHHIAATATATTGATTGSTSMFSVSVQVTITDTDADGMPNDYEIAHPGLNVAFNDAALDLDGDGMSNLGEFRAGTDPKVPANRVQLTISRIVSDAALDLTTEPGIPYTIEKRSDLSGPGEWSIFVDNLNGDGSLMRVTDPGAIGAGRGFYRALLK